MTTSRTAKYQIMELSDTDDKMAAFVMFEEINELKDTCRDHRNLKKNQIYNIIIKMKNSVDKFYSSLDIAKDKINKLEDRSEEIWNVAQRDNMVENTDEMSVLY